MGEFCSVELGGASDCPVGLASSIDAARDASMGRNAGSWPYANPPTIKTLETISRHRSFEDLIGWAAECVEWGVTTMIPMIIKRQGKPEIVLPGDRDYPGMTS